MKPGSGCYDKVGVSGKFRFHTWIASNLNSDFKNILLKFCSQGKVVFS